MNFWIIFWTVTFFVALGLFAMMAVWVTIDGWRDIRKLFHQLEGDREKRLGDEAARGDDES